MEKMLFQAVWRTFNCYTGMCFMVLPSAMKSVCLGHHLTSKNTILNLFHRATLSTLRIEMCIDLRYIENIVS